MFKVLTVFVSFPGHVSCNIHSASCSKKTNKILCIGLLSFFFFFHLLEKAGGLLGLRFSNIENELSKRTAGVGYSD